MSFILDALKKAESERHRASGPVLVDVRLATPRRGLPLWAWVLAGVLLANLLVLMWLMLRKPAVPEVVAAGNPVAAAGTTRPSPAVEQASAPPTAPPSQVQAPPATMPAPPPAGAQPAPGAAAPAPPARTGDGDPLPTLQDLLASGVSLPPLLMNLHVYDPSPALRYILLNGLRLKEGEFTPDGIKVQTITERGAILEARGRRFLLPAGG